MATKLQTIKTGIYQWIWFILVVFIFSLWLFLTKATRTNMNPTSWQWDPTNLYSNWDDTLTKEKWNALVEKVENNVWSSSFFWNIITTYAKNTTYQATKDWFVLGYCNWSWRTKFIQSVNSDLSNPVISFESQDEATWSSRERIISPVKKSNYRKFDVTRWCSSANVIFFPLN